MAQNLPLNFTNQILLLHFKPSNLKLDSNIEWAMSNKTYLNIVEIFNKLLKKMNIREMQNLIVTLTRKKGYFK